MLTHLPTLSTEKSPRLSILLWFSLSMLCAGVIALLALQLAFGNEYTVQDDARQHVFWIQRLIDPELFPNDLIANYFQSVAPLGYTTVYRIAALVGIEPLLFCKLLPAFLGLISAAYCFGVCIQILPIPIAGFWASLLLSQNLMMADDLYSATPRAFLYPLFLAFLYYLLRRSLLPCLTAIALLGLFYPQVLFVSCGILVFSLIRWEGCLPKLSQQRKDYLFCGLGLAVGAIVMVPFILQGGSAFGPVVTVAQAKEMPEFWDPGRNSFFNHNPLMFWLFSERSGMLARSDRVLLPLPMLLGLLLPFLMRRPARFPLVRQITDDIRVLQWTLLSSVSLFFAAHLLLFKLHIPNRYTQHSFRILLAIAAAIALTVLLDALSSWVRKRPTFSRKRTSWGIAGFLALTLVIYPAIAPLKTAYPGLRVLGNPFPGYVQGRAPETYRFFKQQPKDILIASVLLEANNLPIFAHRSVLAAREFAIPYHLGYYRQFRERVIDQIQAQYSTNPKQVKQFTEKYGIDFWVVDANAPTPRYLQKSWLQQYQPAAAEAANSLQQGTVPVVQQAVERCAVLQENGLAVLSADCVVNSLPPSMAQ